MKTILSSETMDIPEGINIKVKAKQIEVEGPRGKLTRNFKHLNLDFQLIKDEETGQKKLKVDAWFGSRKTTAAIRTALSHVENLITGVTKGYRYKMRFVYAHFPINASITGGNKSIEIRNFLGEKRLIKDEETGQKKLKVDTWFGSRKIAAAICTTLSHVDNLITGVTKGYRYKMRSIYAHFPISASISGGNKSIEIRNFLGEKRVRKVDMLDGVTVVRSEKVKDELVLDGNDIELVSRSAALINQKCHVKNKDIRKFLDGIYVSEKGRIAEEE
ncbi:hypothetical protein RND71_004887 [Anisodus tanguticus]|uniref:Large ribosomal subunit protein uL6 alpha-beta domain-containing protein n=1 Tax=Anisodus tanguticus TaxID=243964 RepID=A0AAE1SQY4_9SOLA|nr:hypothetical protein RND71_004887 [Anisodus tanguticus]